MSLIRLISRGFGAKSNRSESPFVKTNIRLTHCVTVKEFLSIITAEKLIMSQKTFSLRVLTRIFVSRFNELSEIQDPWYSSLCQEIEENIHSFRSQELCDVLYWIRNSRSFGLPSLSPAGMDKITQHSLDLYHNSALTNRQFVTVLFDNTHSGLNVQGFKEPMQESIRKFNKYYISDDIKQLLYCIQWSRILIDEESFLILVNKAKELNSETVNVKEALEMVANISAVASRSQLSSPQVSLITKEIVSKSMSLINYYSEYDLLKVLEIQKDCGLFPDQFIQKIFEKAIANIKHGPKSLSSLFLMNMIEITNSFSLISSELQTLLMLEMVDRLNSKEIEFTFINRLFAQFYYSNIDLSPLIQASNRICYENFPKSRSFIDFLLFREKYAKDGDFKSKGVIVVFI